MTHVHFFRLACRESLLLPLVHSLVQQAVNQRLDVLLLTRDEQEAKDIHSTLDALLGCQLSAAPASRAVLNCCWHDEPGHHKGLLINLQDDTPAWFSRFDRLAEFVWEEPQLVGRKRENYRLFRDRGYPLIYTELADGNDLDHVSLHTKTDGYG